MTTEATPTTPAPAAPEAPAQGATSEEPLGAPGLAALKSERDAKAAAEKRAAAAEARVKEFEDREKTETQKQQEALDKAQRELAEVTLAKTRAEVAAAKGVPAGLLTGDTQEALEASADALIAFKGDKQPDRLVVGGEGGTPTPKETNAERFAALIEEKLS